MKKVLTIINVLLVIGFVSAHAPSEVDIRLNEDTLIVSAIHNSKKPSKHFVNKVSVAINGTEVTAKVFTRQNSNEGLNTEIILPRKTVTGDVITVTARCNKKGERSNELRVPEAELLLAVEEIEEEILEEPIEKVALDDQLQLGTEEIEEEVLEEEDSILAEEITAGVEVLEE